MKEEYEPFNNAEEVWFWFCSSLQARGDGLRSRTDYWGKPRCCEISDIVRIIKQMKRQKYISNRHLRVMSDWGARQESPWYNHRAKRSEVRLWDEGLRNFDVYLRHYRIL